LGETGIIPATLGDTAGEDRHGSIETTGKSYVEHNANHIPTAGRAALAPKQNQPPKAAEVMNVSR
jgi:hypothetical protein